VSVIVDASVVVALVVADERQAAARARLEEWLEAGEDPHAPALLPYEVANVLARLVFDGDLEADSNMIGLRVAAATITETTKFVPLPGRPSDAVQPS
jgi:predicted nucleic acid-binding protein